MPEEMTPNDRTLFVLLDGLALALMFSAVEKFSADKVWSIGCVVVAIALSSTAHNWVAIKPKFKKRFSGLGSNVGAIFADYRYRTGGLFLVAFLIGTIFLIYIGGVRRDVDTYLLPRTLTKIQSEELSKAVSGVHSDTKINILYSASDPEATQYAGQLFMAIRNGNWDIQMQPINLWNPKDQPENPFNHFVLEQGLGMEVCILGQPSREDEKHLEPFTILRAAMQKAEIEVNSSGEKADCGVYVLNLIVGRRPFQLGQGPTLMQKLARQFSRLVQE